MSVMVSCRLSTGRQKPLHLPTKTFCTFLQNVLAKNNLSHAYRVRGIRRD